MPIQTFALSSGKVPAAKPMHTGTLGKTSRGGVNRSYFEDTPSGSSGGLVSLPDGVLLLSIWAASARAQWWPGRGEKRVTRATAGLALTAALPTSAGRGSALNAQRPNAAPASSATPRPCRPAKPALLGHTSAAGLTKSPAIYLSPSRFRHFAGGPRATSARPAS